MPPALVTRPPVLVDTVGFARQFSDEVNPWLFFTGGSLYVVMVPVQSLTPNVAAGVWKSADGTAWAPKDQANAPGVPAPGYTGKCCNINPATGEISILLNDNSNSERLVATFATASELYAALSAGSPVLTGAAFAAIYQQSNGKVVSPQNSIVAGLNKLRELDLDGGVWAGPNQLGNVASPLVYGCAPDSSDRGHLFYADAAFNLQYALISAALTLGVPVQVASSANWDGNDIDQRTWNNKIAVAFTNSDVLYVAIGSPLAGAAFSVFTVGSVPSSGNLQYPTLAEDRNGKLVVFVAWTDFSGAPVDQLLMWTFDGGSSFGSPVLFYDEIANPPANSVPQVNQFIHNGAAHQFANGSWVFITDLEVKPDGVHIYCAAHSLVTAPVGGDLELDVVFCGVIRFLIRDKVVGALEGAMRLALAILIGLAALGALVANTLDAVMMPAERGVPRFISGLSVAVD